MNPTESWSFTGVKDRQLVRPDWSPADPIEIEGVAARQITSVLTDNGYLTEIWRADWCLDIQGVEQIFQRTLDIGAVSGWHVHARTTDRLFCAVGRVRVALFDARSDSSTHGKIAEFRLGTERPAIVKVPPGVWHAVRNIGPSSAVFVNAVDIAYDYEDPDHYRLPLDTPLIPHSV